MKISVCVITLNEEQNLRRCLESCRELADEIIVLDSGSTDATERIARQFNARWRVQPWMGYVGQKNAALDLATHEWILSLDADEELSPRLQREVRELKRAAIPEEVSGFSMPRCVLYEGRWIRHGDWYPDRLIRLFRRDRGRFAGGKVHERLELTGVARRLNGDLFHHSFVDAADHWARCEKYARLWAETQFEAGKNSNAAKAFFHAAFRWMRAYLLRGGFLDGRLGWRIAVFSAREVYRKHLLLRDMNAAVQKTNQT